MALTIRMWLVCFCVQNDGVCVSFTLTMTQWQLCTLEHLMSSGYGRPFPRHGLQLLFWFANHCVTCDRINSVVVMKVRLTEMNYSLIALHLVVKTKRIHFCINQVELSSMSVLIFQPACAMSQMLC